MSTSDERRELRRQNMVHGKASSFDEHEAQGIAFWRSATPSQKLDAMVELIEAAWYLQGGHGPAPGLDRSAHGAGKIGH